MDQSLKPENRKKMAAPNEKWPLQWANSLASRMGCATLMITDVSHVGALLRRLTGFEQDFNCCLILPCFEKPKKLKS